MASNNVNGPKVTIVAPHAGNGVSAAGYMLERLSIRRYSTGNRQ